jgi:hypothetical protein
MVRYIWTLSQDQKIRGNPCLDKEDFGKEFDSS